MSRCSCWCCCKPWSRLLFAAFVGTVSLFVAWAGDYYSDAQFARTAFFLVTCFFLIFAFAPRLVRVKQEEIDAIAGWDALALILLPIATAGAGGFIGFYAMLEGTASEWATPWLAVVFAAFYLPWVQRTGPSRTARARSSSTRRVCRPACRGR